VSGVSRRWRKRMAGGSAGGNNGPSAQITQEVNSEGAANIAGHDQSTFNIDQVNLSLNLSQLLRRWPDAAPYVYDVASENGIPVGATAGVEDLVAYLADLNIPAEAFPAILRVGELIRRYATDPDMRDGFASIAEQWAALVPARQESLGKLRSESGESDEWPPADPCLLIALDPDYYSTDRYRLSIIAYRNGHDGDRRDDNESAMSVAEIEVHLRLSLPLLFQVSHGQLLVEFAVPPELLCTAFDQWFIPNRPGGHPDEDCQLGERFPVVVRDIERMSPGTDRHLWEHRWRLLGHCRRNDSSSDALRWILPEDNETFRQLRASLRHTDSHGKACLGLLPGPTASMRRTELLKAGLDAGIPAAIWLREADQGATALEDDRQYLKKVTESADLHSLPSTVLNLRLQAVAEGEPAGHPGSRLGLLWADPQRTWERPFRAPEPSSSGADF
jgi:vWA-MoxR associated protein C-terminal domain